MARSSGSGPRGGRSLAAVVALLAGLAVVAGGCGGGGSSSTTTNATEAWANGVCSAFSDWKASLEQVKTSVSDPSKLSKDSIQKAIDQTQTANQKLVDDLSSLEKPQTDAGKQAAQTVDTLQQQLKADVDSIQKAVQSGSLAALAGVGTTMSTMSTQLQAAVGNLKQLDAKGELNDAFQSSPACEPFFGTKK